MKEKDKEGFYREFECPICNEQMKLKALTCDEDTNYSQFKCSKHGLVEVYKSGNAYTLLNSLKRNCIEYISLLNINDAGMHRVEVHQAIAYALGLKHHDEELQEITDNLDKHIGVPINSMASPLKYGIKLYKLLMEKFGEKNVNKS